MFTAFQLLDKINTHVSELQFTRSPKGLYAPVEYVLSLGETYSPRVDADGI